MSGICKVHQYKDPDCQSCEEISPEEVESLVDKPPRFKPFTPKEMEEIWEYRRTNDLRLKQLLGIAREYMTGFSKRNME